MTVHRKSVIHKVVFVGGLRDGTTALMSSALLSSKFFSPKPVRRQRMLPGFAPMSEPGEGVETYTLRRWNMAGRSDGDFTPVRIYGLEHLTDAAIMAKLLARYIE